MRAIKTPGGVTRWVPEDQTNDLCPIPDAVPSLLRSQMGHVLREVRTARKMTLREVAKKAHMALGYVSEVERGLKEASSEVLNDLCTALDLELHHLLQLVIERLRPTEVPDTPAQIAGEMGRPDQPATPRPAATVRPSTVFDSEGLPSRRIEQIFESPTVIMHG